MKMESINATGKKKDKYMHVNSLFIRFSRISRISPNRYNGDNHKIIDHRQHIDQYIVSIGRTYLKYIVMISV